MVISPSGIGYFDTKPEDVVVMKLDGTIINDVNPVFSEAEFEKLKEWIELNKLAILLYWTQEEIGYMEILKYIHPIDKNEDKIK